jgi:hypothetical protein
LLGNTLQTLARFDESADAYRRASQIDPDAFDAASNSRSMLLKMGRAQEALVMYEQVAPAGRPGGRVGEPVAGVADARGFRARVRGVRDALADVSAGKYRFTAPSGDGSDPHGKTILLMNEQGLGDTIHFVRYATLLATRGARTIVACPPTLRELIMTVKGVSAVADGKQLVRTPGAAR